VYISSSIAQGEAKDLNHAAETLEHVGQIMAEAYAVRACVLLATICILSFSNILLSAKPCSMASSAFSHVSLEHVGQIMAEAYAVRAGKNKQELVEMMARETWLNAETSGVLLTKAVTRFNTSFDNTCVLLATICILSFSNILLSAKPCS
jgi:hypothetical protein